MRVLFFLALSLYGQPAVNLAPGERQLNLDSFEKVWTTIRDKHWEKNPGGLDWQAIHAEFRPKVENAKNIDELRAILREMLGRLHQTHFGIFPTGIYQAIGDADAAGDGSSGIDLRLLDGQAVVTGVDPGSPAERAGVKPGWAIVNVKGRDVAAGIRELAADPTVPELMLTRALLARLSGPVGGKANVTFLDGAGRMVALDLDLVPSRGQLSRFGNLPEMRVWFESKRLDEAPGRIGYVRFNMFLDLPRVMESFGKAVTDCEHCSGFIVDLRGNPGGIGGMAMGMAGYLVTQQGLRLGSMYTRDATLNFVINPRLGAFTGPLAILVDSGSASTSEIFAGGLKDLGRARVFGTRTAAAALPSVVERLPNGDGFQYAVANYISEGGKPLEGIGVQPDVDVKLSREALLAGRDSVVDAALEWIRKQRIQ
jgi:carboxyl-terminal processing protease